MIILTMSIAATYRFAMKMTSIVTINKAEQNKYMTRKSTLELNVGCGTCFDVFHACQPVIDCGEPGSVEAGGQ